MNGRKDGDRRERSDGQRERPMDRRTGLRGNNKKIERFNERKKGGLDGENDNEKDGLDR